MAGNDRAIDIVDARVLTAVSRNPVGTAKDLSVAAGISQGRFAKRLRRLGETGILYPGFAKAQVAYSAVGLEQALVLADVPHTEWQTFERACDVHPYAQFRIRCLGKVSGNSFIALFSTPAGARHLLIDFLQGLKERGVLSGYSVSSPIAKPERTEFDFTRFNPNNGSWDVDWSRWEASIDGKRAALTNFPKVAMHLLDAIDMKVLRMLSTDGRADKWKLAEKVGVRDYELSRRLRCYSENAVIDGYRIIHARNIAGLALTIAVLGTSPVSVTERLLGSLRALPFQGSFYPLEDGFAYIGNVPPTELASFSKAVQAQCDGVEISLCDYSSSMRYLFDNEPSNFKDGYGWLDDHAYAVDAPLAGIEPSKLSLIQR